MKKKAEKFRIEKVVKCDVIEKWYPEIVMGSKRAWKDGPCCYSPTPSFLWDPCDKNAFIGGALHELLPKRGQWKVGKKYRVVIEEI